MRKVRIVMVGKTPLMMDQMSEDVLNSLDTGVRIQIVKERPVEDKAAEKIYRDQDGRIGLSPDMLLAALVNGGRNVKMGKKQISTATTTTLFDLLSLESPFLFLTNGRDQDEPEWAPDKRRGVSNQSKSPTAVCIVRPKFNEWAFEAVITYDEKKAGRDTIQKLFKEAGSSQGVGSFRPNKKGRYGMFTVREWHEETLKVADDKIIMTLDGKDVDDSAPSEKKVAKEPAADKSQAS